MLIDHETPRLAWWKKIPARQEVSRDGLKMCVLKATPWSEVVIGGNVSHQEVQ